jgi:ribosomal protein L18E
MLVEFLGLNAETQNELQKIETLEFNIFKMQAFTKENELMVVSTVILQKEGIF